MSQPMRRAALFEGLVFDQSGRPLEVAYVGDMACYVLLDEGFRHHLDSESIDRQVVGMFQEQALANREVLTTKIMEMIGKDDIFTKAMIEDSFRNMGRVLEVGLPEDARNMLGLVGFRIIVDSHGEIVDIKMPQEAEGGDR